MTCTQKDACSLTHMATHTPVAKSRIIVFWIHFGVQTNQSVIQHVCIGFKVGFFFIFFLGFIEDNRFILNSLRCSEFTQLYEKLFFFLFFVVKKHFCEIMNEWRDLSQVFNGSIKTDNMIAVF